MKKLLLANVICVLALAGCDKPAGTSTTSTTSNPPSENTAVVTQSNTTPPRNDNTAVNTRDRAADAKTAGMQGQTKPDVDITAEIRKRVMATEMSVNAKNSKIVTQDGKVTLRGPVKDQNEKDAIARIATDVAGTDKVDNQLEIQTETTATAAPQ